MVAFVLAVIGLIAVAGVISTVFVVRRIRFYEEVIRRLRTPAAPPTAGGM